MQHKIVVVKARRYCTLRCKPRTLDLSMETMSSYFHMPLDEAAKKLGIASTTLKLICRKLGVPRWPYRNVQKEQRRSLDHSIGVQPSFMSTSSLPDRGTAVEDKRGVAAGAVCLMERGREEWRRVRELLGAEALFEEAMEHVGGRGRSGR
ncbi:hypothetical protein GUITHDRAFT_115050 [Guillardia theta CCMP2712]|uniref:RWP-RK domain-containing protein n=1 Tax=Guillardia theta (strain CCMP2712) TaxID=905079 RepID=L1ISQ9_GUITC|nr:hypothetical protein GUITHDRAFT_115050 [Guillardia theta CCMP2712]EKX38944.1 hypothetical protein GUITHDRAFT_115050 [Guillardia theta CCMP2712]|eukprot:XP_005825924.1 hypothetical protein GUITHDRAFT_115050 [Guillardia theta CCMP2712]